jgi:hypothetical protein
MMTRAGQAPQRGLGQLRLHHALAMSQRSTRTLFMYADDASVCGTIRGASGGDDR